MVMNILAIHENPSKLMDEDHKPRMTYQYKEKTPVKIGCSLDFPSIK